MYLAVGLLTMLVLPVGSILVEHHLRPLEFFEILLLKWFVFWSVGIRLALAGSRQFFQPRFTAVNIFQMHGDEALPVIRELGVANFAVGMTAILSLWRPWFCEPMAIAGAIFYGIAGVRHIAHPNKSRNENIAMVSDIFAAVVLVAALVLRPHFDA